jgi:hypothetical protein
MNAAIGRRSLIVLNVVLLLVLAAVALSPRALAQRGSRARGEYTMVSGRIIGGNSHIVYILDGANQEVLAAKWNESSKSVDVIGYRDMQADAQSQPGR